MIILNTTFHIHASLLRPFSDWLRSEYISAAVASGSFAAPRLVRVLGGKEDDPEGISLALSMEAPALAAAKRWHDGPQATLLREKMRLAFGSETVFFTTYLQVIE